jgi:pimeloyl-ACP methyl ester carboxylesterase
MSADVRKPPIRPEPFRFGIPDAAWRRLRLRLGRGVATGEPLDVALAYGVDPDELSQLADYWLNYFDPERQPLNDLPWFTTGEGEPSFCFVHARSPETSAAPLLLLHGYCGSVSEFQGLLPALSDPRAHGEDGQVAFQVVCPALPGFGLSAPVASARMAAEACSALMARLGYTRYWVQGSDLGANIALELGALDSQHVAGLWLTSVPAYPSEDPLELTALSSHEKSQLARLDELHAELHYHLPESPLEALAFALSGLDVAVPAESSVRDSLLQGLTLSWSLGNLEARNALYRASRLAPSPSSSVPVSVHAFPLDAPNLRRFAEREQRIVEWTEHARGGRMPGLEQPQALLQSLRAWLRNSPHVG